MVFKIHCCIDHDPNKIKMNKNTKNYEIQNVGYMIAKEHKNQCFGNSKSLYCYFLCAGKTNIWPFLGVFPERHRLFWLLNCPLLRSQQFEAQKRRFGPLETVVMCFVQIKKTFRTFRISNTIIVQILLEMFNVDLAELQQKLFSIIFSPQPPGKCKLQFFCSGSTLIQSRSILSC